MPFWKVYHPVGAFTADDKRALSERITELYRGLPKFYVIVAFQEVAPDSLYMGGKPVDNFIRVWVDHIARSFPPDAKKMKAKWMAKAEAALAPYIKDRGRDWEIHIDETPFDLWHVQGMAPPPPNSEYEKLWVDENKPVPYPVEEPV
jgi:phenylpyruvate tautomerase PptA (4-oxalocrotonate tautomerase family)